MNKYKSKKTIMRPRRSRLAMIGMLTALLSVAGTAEAVDTDGDGVDDSVDNCTLVQNPAQRDTDADNFGNFCDPDLNNDLTVQLLDFSLFRAVFGTPDPDADFNGNGTVGTEDFSILRAYFGVSPGPSCLSQPGACVVAAAPTARPDTYGTPFGKTLNVTASRISGVLHNDEDPQD